MAMNQASLGAIDKRLCLGNRAGWSERALVTASRDGSWQRLAPAVRDELQHVWVPALGSTGYERCVGCGRFQRAPRSSTNGTPPDAA